MDEKNWRKRLRDAASCRICLDYLTEPVTLECGHNFCSSCIASCWRLTPDNSICPRCWRVVETKELSPNIAMAHMVEFAQDLINRSVFSKEEAEKFAKAQIEAMSMNIRAAFRKYYQFLEEQEALLLSQMEEVKAEVSRRRDENLATLSRELSPRDGHIQELEEKQQQSATELQD